MNIIARMTRATRNRIAQETRFPAWQALIVIALSVFIPGAALGAAPSKTTLIELPSGTQITAEVAQTPARRTLGLMFREHLPPDRGMLLVFDSSDFHGIWMKNCRIPLDLIWMDRSGRVVHLEENAPPCEEIHCPSLYPARKALYVLELNAGMIRSEELRLGHKLDLGMEDGGSAP